MGCCFSSHENKTTPKNNTHQYPCVSKSPPVAEEEAVKEVLSETPKPKSRPGSRPDSPKPEVLAEDEEIMKPKLMLLSPKKANSEQKLGTKNPDPVTPEEISEVSENVCSFSESVSTTTHKEEDDQLHQFHQQKQNQNPLLCSSNTKDTAASGEVRQRVFRSQGYNDNFPHHQQQQLQQHCKSQRRSPARRRPEPESSPVRKRHPGPVEPRREMVGGNSGRRSQSPGKRANVGRSPSTRRNGPSPGRVRMVNGPEKGAKMKEEEGNNEEEENGLRRESEEWQGPKESLENPLVSLECFIFL